MFIFVRFLKKQSVAQQLPSYGHGWLELPNGQRWQPSASRAQFVNGRPQVQARRRSFFSRLLAGVRNGQ